MKSRFKILLISIFVPLIFIATYAVSSAKEPDIKASDAVEWCTVSFYNRGELWYEEKVEYGTSLASVPTSPKREGYKFSAWVGDNGIFEAGARVYSNSRYEAEYELLPPSFEISSLEFEYDGRGRELAFSEMSHPYFESGIISYEWFKDGDAIDVYSPSLILTNVSDSGFYCAKLTFSVMGDVATVMTSPVSVQIKKRSVEIPRIPAQTYTGNVIHPEIFDTGAYSVEKSTYILTGTYPIKITLNDSENYAFVGHDQPFVYVDFVIESANNYFIDDLRINDVFTSFSPTPYALPRFGDAVYLYSLSEDGVYSTNPPIYSGDYFVKAVVNATDCYSGIESEPVKFTVIEEVVSGIAINTNPEILKYKAFDRLIKDGLSVRVSYNSGRQMIVFEDEIDVGYMNADSFRYGDRGVVISYCGVSVVLLVDVSKTDYDLADIILPDYTAVYNGEMQTANVSLRLPVGDDGIPLTARVVGGGCGVGTYRISLVFETESKNYNLPEPIYANFTVTAREVSASWGQTEFVYDGTPKLPSAFYVDLNGRRVSISTVGERTNAGVYTARAEIDDPNYMLINPTAEFTVLKARYDMSGVIWQGGGEKYDAKKKRATLSNLPDGVYVIGYVNASFVNCGKYVATATLSYDEKNYEMPIVPSYEWEILPAEYDLSEFEFLDNSAEYSGDRNYPILSGKMPTGKDGITLEYEFFGSAVNVADGEVTVEIRFFTKSENYIAPESIYRTVCVVPKGISVNWHSLYFVYTGAVNIPYAVSEYTSVSVVGGACDAGEYLAYAKADDVNYYVINDTVEYTVSSAPNRWVKEPEISNVFFGDVLNPVAEALGDIVVFRYYSDSECTELLSGEPSEVGVYYMVAESSGGRNYLSIASSAIKFEIIAIVPIGLDIVLDKVDYTALDSITDTDFSAYLCYNNGKRESLLTQEIDIVYSSAGHLVFGDRCVAFRYGDFYVEQEINVEKRRFELSSVSWCGLSAVYDGAPKYAYLCGLPSQIEVIRYIGNGQTEAGQYTVTPELKYDTHNYLPPEIENATLTVEKQVVAAPVIQSAEYDGTQKLPIIPTDSRYTHAFSFTAVNSGNYGVLFELVDSKNYCFENGLPSISVAFILMPRSVKIALSDVDIYLFQKEDHISVDWEVVEGSIVSGDELRLCFFVDGDKLFAVSDNGNYSISVIPSEINRHILPSPYVTAVFILAFAIILIIALIAVFVLINRNRIKAELVSYTVNSANTEVLLAPAVDIDAEQDLQEPDELSGGSSDEPASMGVSVDYAESAITNSLAKNLIRRDEDVITNGHRHGIVNIDTLSRSFSAGDRVDINALKNKSLIPYDTGYIKVLARGIIDKPLYVYANDFSLAAVKMIALTGGKAIKVNTAQKNRENKDG